MATHLFGIIQAASGLRFLVVLITLCLSTSGFGASGGKLKVLWISSWNKNTLWQQELEKGVSAFAQAHQEDATIYNEYLDSGRFSGEGQRGIFYRYLNNKYADVDLDYVVFEGGPAAKLYIEHQDIAKQSKSIILNPGSVASQPVAKSLRIPVNLSTRKAVATVLTMTPGKTVYLLAGVQTLSQTRLADVKRLINEIEPNRKVEVINNQTLENVTQQVSRLSNGIVIYLLLFQDGEGQQYEPYDAIVKVRKTSAVPVYSFWTSLLGSGVLGGYMLSGEKVGREMGKLLFEDGYNQLLASEKTIPSDNFHGYYFDWRQMQHWHIDVSDLPANAEVMFQEPSLLQRYYLEIASFFIVAVGLLLFLRHRELKRFTTQLQSAHEELKYVNTELSLAQNRLQLQNRRLEELTIRDGLTGLYNRGYADRALQYECEKAERYGSALSIVVIDIDHFKAVNDRYGHKVGDKVLIRFSKIMACNIRSTDIIARWGGEEFIILCPGLDHQHVLALAEKLRKKLITVEFETVSKISASFGVATYSKGLTKEQLFEVADTALYVSKSNGRNCVSG